MSNLLILFFVLLLRFLLPLPSSGGSIDKAVGFNRQPSIPVSPAASVVRLQWARWPPGLAAHNPSRASEPTMQWVGSSWALGGPATYGQSDAGGLASHSTPTLLAWPLGLSRFGQFPGYRLDCAEQSLDTIRRLIPMYPITRSQPSWRA